MTCTLMRVWPLICIERGDCLLERAGFELSVDFVNGQQIIRKRQRVQKWLPRSRADSRIISVGEQLCWTNFGGLPPRNKIDAPVCREGDAAASLVSLGSVGRLVTQTQTFRGYATRFAKVAGKSAAQRLRLPSGHLGAAYGGNQTLELTCVVPTDIGSHAMERYTGVFGEDHKLLSGPVITVAKMVTGV